MENKGPASPTQIYSCTIVRVDTGWAIWQWVEAFPFESNPQVLSHARPTRHGWLDAGIKGALAALNSDISLASWSRYRTRETLATQFEHPSTPASHIKTKMPEVAPPQQQQPMEATLDNSIVDRQPVRGCSIPTERSNSVH